ncbi:DUF2007 domain-containing protein [Patiriisocius marinus]|uniref:Signal transducing protein n=1 Tax=Patiriisocius marinus TaxID=1397112 RepID=A0A5J4J4E0_9FLAO|nr:DUF2007 domain-containing protein [Patiriisocius marinus]GER60898.1 hypothetical protein ULMA_30060 [Patiriisocius marinus]
MDNTKKTTRIYTGPAMIANGLIARLNEVNIQPIIKDDHQSGITGGFAMGIPNQVRLFIRQEELEASKDIIDAYLKEVDEVE